MPITAVRRGRLRLLRPERALPQRRYVPERRLPLRSARPCATLTDCQNPLVCEDNVCRWAAGHACTTTPQCVKGLACENLICQRPHCIVTPVETQPVPGGTVWWASQSMYMAPNGEIYVTHGQWNMYQNYDIRRFRVAPGQTAVEQDPAPPAPLLTFGSNSPIAEGSSDQPGSAQGTATVGGTFWWMPGGGAWDGRISVTIKFTGFNSDLDSNMTNEGRFAKCGSNFYFFGGQYTTKKYGIRFDAGGDPASLASAVTLTTSAARRDTWPFTSLINVACTPTAVWVLGSNGTTPAIQKLDPLTLVEMGAPISVALPYGNLIGDWTIAIVSDDLFYLVDTGGGIVWQVYKGAGKQIGKAVANSHAFGTQNGLAVFTNTSVIRYEKQMMNGMPPPLDIDCQWQ